MSKSLLISIILIRNSDAFQHSNFRFIFFSVISIFISIKLYHYVFFIYFVLKALFRLITPFLVLAVGVDDAFLVLHKWFTSVELDPSARLASVLVEIGPSVTLTSVTNTCAFMVSVKLLIRNEERMFCQLKCYSSSKRILQVGSFLSPYAIREFCYCSALALTLDWIFQILVFTPVLLEIHSCSFNVSRKSNKRFVP